MIHKFTSHLVRTRELNNLLWWGIWKTESEAFGFGCWIMILNLMTTILNSSSLVHHNSWKSYVNISIRVGDSDIHPVPLVRNLGCWFDSRLSMASHITKLCASSFYYVYNIRRIRKYLTWQSPEILVHASITSRLDYCNGLLYGLSDCFLNKLQRVQNACARLIFREQKFCHVTPLIYEFTLSCNFSFLNHGKFTLNCSFSFLAFLFRF